MTENYERHIYLSVHQVADMLGVSVDSIWRWTRAGTFPAPVKLGSRTTRWTLREIEERAQQSRA